MKLTNARFKAMSKSQKRVAIAKDVLEHLDAEKITARSLIYVEPIITKEVAEKFGGRSLKRLQVSSVYKEVEKCEVCALGAMFFCAVKVANHLTVDKLFDSGTWGYYPRFRALNRDVFWYMKKFFSEEQLTLIEYAFENFYGGSKAYATNEEDLASLMYIGRPPSERMRAIMQNIIKNKGTFVVER